MAKLLHIYLDDHWAGAAAGTALAKRMAAENDESPQAVDLKRIANEIEADRQTLAEIRRQLGAEGGTLKTAAARIGERLSRLKPNGRLFRYSPLSRVLELEALISGVSAKQTLWVALRAFDETRGVLDRFDLQLLETRAVDQLTVLHALHRAGSGDAFGGDD